MIDINIFNEIFNERSKQEAKWGEQNHPNGTGTQDCENLISFVGLSTSYGYVRQSDCAKSLCDSATDAGFVTWAHILLEEMIEAFDEKDDDQIRKELIQVAAVAHAWIQAIDRKIK